MNDCNNVCYISSRYTLPVSVMGVIHSPVVHKHTDTPQTSLTHVVQMWCSTAECRPFASPTLSNRRNQESLTQPLANTQQNTSPALAADLMPWNTDTGQRLLAEAGRTVSVKWEQCFLRNHHLTNEGWWSSSSWGHYFWWGQTICMDGALFVGAATPSG